MSLTNEESLFSGLRRQVEQARDRHHEQLSGLEADKERLHAECAALKREAFEMRASNAAALEEHQRHLAAIARVQADLEALRVAYIAADDDREHFQAGEAMAADEAQQLGPLRRALCFKDERIRELEEEVRAANDWAAAGIEMEQVVAAGLRERIGRLERRLRDKSSEERARSESAEAEHELAVAREQLECVQCEFRDAREALTNEIKTSARQQRRAEEAEDALREAREEARHYREAASERDALRRRLAELEAGGGNTTPRALQPVSPNTPKQDLNPDNAVSPSKMVSRLHRELAHVRTQHAALKAAHDELRDKYVRLSAKREKERQHFKEFHAVYVARKDAKRKRRQLDAASGMPEPSAATPPGPSSHPSSVLGPSSPQAARRESRDEEPPAKRMRSSQLREVENAGPLPSPKSATNNVSHASEDVHKAGPSAGPSKPLSPAADLSAAPSPEPVGHPCPPKSPSPRPVDSPRPAAAADLTGPKPLPSTSAQSTTPALSKRSITAAKLAASVSTPITRTPTPLTRLASRVTPWLGGTTRAPSSSRKPRDSFGSDDAPSPAPTRRLVRDRTGTTSLLEDAPRSATRLDFEGLTPAERAAERKRLAALPAAERRKVYAAYKGKGRYVAPSDTTTFADEYEIDPARNDGVGYQFDAVVRDRAARRRMHGGDCECCRDYYAAVGDIPRFHSAPAWRDEPDGDAGGAGAGDTPAGVGIEDHQKRVSRHREVWRRPPTPPDFWKIAFPTTQEVEDVNRRADEMTAAREAEVRREAAHKDSKWRKRV